MSKTIDELEVAKFAHLVEHWWDTEAALKTLHDINPARLQFITNDVALAGKHVLDVGCGGGILSEALAKQGAKVTGIDAEKGAIDVARAHAKDHNLDIDYQATAIEEFNAEPFDLITCMELLEHVSSPATLLSHCKRLLKPGGLLLVSTINRTWQAYLLAVIAAEYVLRLLPRQTHDYAKFITPAELTQMARSLGLTLISMKGLSYNPLKRDASLQDSVSVNYMMSFEGK